MLEEKGKDGREVGEHLEVEVVSKRGNLWEAVAGRELICSAPRFGDLREVLVQDKTSFSSPLLNLA